MEKKEQEMLEKIRSSSGELRVPEALEPEHVKEMLEKRDREKEEGKGEKRRRTVRFLSSVRGRQVAALAAGLALVCLAGAAYTMGAREASGSPEGESYHISTSSGGAGPETETETESGKLTAAGSYDDIYACLEEYQEAYEENEPGGISGFHPESREVTAESASPSGAEESSQAAAASGAADYAGSYSDTNIRQEGVDEGDVVKTDGRYIYTLTDEGEITIVDTADGMEEAGVISEDRQILEFYVADSRLMLLTYAVDADEEKADYDIWSSGTALVTYDISDRGAPRKLGEVTQSGSYRSSRMVGDHVYVFTTFYADMFAEAEARETYIPQAGGSLIQESSIYLPETDSPSQYLVMTSTDIKTPDRIADSKALFAGYGELYVSNENIYWYEVSSGYDGFGWEYSTLIRKISYKEGRLEAVAKGSVPGTIDDSFSIDEYEGNLRVVTTDENANGLYILGPDLEETGRIDNLAKDEQVYSARLMGDMGYFVTFRNTDPLFSVDLSDPENPQILGELKGAGKTIIISSHVLSELSELCTDIGIIDQGHMVLEGEIGDILSRVNTSNPLLISVYSGRETALAVLRGHPLVQTISVQDQDISVRFSGNAQEEAMLLQQLMENGVLVHGFTREKGSLESVFMQLTDREEERVVTSYEAESSIQP